MTHAPKLAQVSNKAGIVLFGDVAGVRHIVAPYSEGRFGNNFKYYGLAKGKVDPGEDMLEAAMREASEETGIDIKKLLGKEAIAKLRRGEVVENIDSGYDGVRIKRVMPDALEYDYLGRGGSPHHFALFAIELDGIEQLHEHLKNPHNRSHYLGMPQEVYHPVRTMLAENRDKYPSLEQCLDWLRTMHMPNQPWSNDRGGESLPRINGEGDHWFADLEADYMDKTNRPGGRIRTVGEWRGFLKQLGDENYQILSKHAEKIKETLIQLGVISGNDADIIKFDTKDTPLIFYQEGSDILTADNYLKAVIKSGLELDDFNIAFCGDIPSMVAKNAPRMERIVNSQMAGVVWATEEKAIEHVANRYQAKPAKTHEDNRWLGGNMYDDSLRTDLKGVLSHMRAHEVPITKIVMPYSEGRMMPPPHQQQIV